MKYITLLLTSLITLNIYASDLLDSSYNRVAFGFSSQHGDGEGTSTAVGASYKPGDIPFVLSYGYGDSDIDEILGDSVDGLDANANVFALGYVIKSNPKLHIIPTVSFGSSEVSYSNIGSKADSTTLGISFRSMANENTVFNFSLVYASLEVSGFSSKSKAAINDILDDRGYDGLTDSEFDELEDELQSSTFAASLGLEYHFEENVVLSYGITTDFDSTSLGFGIGFNY